MYIAAGHNMAAVLRWSKGHLQHTQISA